MKFVVDAHLPPRLCALLRRHGHDVIHTMSLPAGNATDDADINAISMAEARVVISKDADFFYSHLVRGRPWKLLLVRTGNISVAELNGLFERNLVAIEQALVTHTLVELDRGAVTPVPRP